MIVDLLRNDLSRVCRPGTVRVPELFALEQHPTVHHLVSTVRRRARPGVDRRGPASRRFPGGSITGAPKVRAMEIIAELEPTERGLYCGSIGYIGHTGAMDTNIAIRTCVVQRWTRYTSQAAAASSPTPTPSTNTARRCTRPRGSSDAGPPRIVILLIDNYDSFVYNLARYVRELGEEPVVRRNDALTLDDVAALAPSHIIISPGPCSPAEAGISVDVVRRFGPTIPILGVCLGHQCIGAAYGGQIVRATPADARQDLAHRARRDGRLRRPAVAAASRPGITRSSSRPSRCRRVCA